MAADLAIWRPRQPADVAPYQAPDEDIDAVARSLRASSSATSGGLQLTLPAWSFKRSRGPVLGDELKLPVPGTGDAAPGVQRKLSVGASNDPLEHEADRVADQVLSRPQSARASGPWPNIQRAASSHSMAAAEAPASVDRVLASPGRPLEGATQQDMEQRFGQDFSAVRIHEGGPAAQSARDVHAHAYTAGNHIVFGDGRFSPGTSEGRRLLAHELTHVVQQAGDERRLQRFSYDGLKESFYSRLIAKFRAGKKATLDILRSQIGKLPREHWRAANAVVGVVDEIFGVIEALALGIIGIVVGFGEGIVSLITGLITLAMGIIKTAYHFASGIFTNFEELGRDVEQMVNIITGLPSAVSRLVDEWLVRFEKASLERQSLMIGEIVGQIIALIASFAVSSARAGSIATVAEAGGEVAVQGGSGLTEVAASGARATRPTMTVIKGGGQAASAAKSSAALFEGSNVLKIAPAVEEAAPVSGLRVVAAEEQTAVAASKTGTGSRLGKGLASAAALAKAGQCGPTGRLNTMRFQVQWDTDKTNQNFSQTAIAPQNPGVSVAEAEGALAAALVKVVPKTAQDASIPAAVKQVRWIRGRPPAGVGPGVYKRSEYFKFGRFTDARVDVENLVGQNLRM
jgi:hypothetical protein